MGDLSSYFSRAEFACQCGCGFDTVDTETLEVLNLVREEFRAPVTINSGCRCPSHNAAIGGASNSFHTQARAADIVVEGIPPDRVADFLEQGPLKDRGGVGRYSTFTHCDTRTQGPARWNG